MRWYGSIIGAGCVGHATSGLVSPTSGVAHSLVRTITAASGLASPLYQLVSALYRDVSALYLDGLLRHLAIFARRLALRALGRVPFARRNGGFEHITLGWRVIPGVVQRITEASLRDGHEQPDHHG